MKFLVAIMLYLSALACTVAQAEDGSMRLSEFHQKHQQQN